MKRIPLSQNKFVLVDDEDYKWLSKKKWYYVQEGYAYRTEKIKGTRKNKGSLMHREILKAGKGQICDHINGNRLDNRRNNLRLCTPTQNTQNRLKTDVNTSGYKGVSWHKKDKRWRATIQHKYIGNYKDIKEAAKAYNEKAKELYGEFANLNIL